MRIYKLLNLDELDCCVAVIKNARSTKYGRKDIIKIDGIIDLDLDILGYVDHNITVDIIKDGRIAEKKQLVLPKLLKNVIRCKNPGASLPWKQKLTRFSAFAVKTTAVTDAFTANRNTNNIKVGSVRFS